MLNAAFGLYRRRLKVMKEWGLVGRHLSVLDIGCGIGQYAGVTDGVYAGLDLNEGYVAYARKRAKGNASFRCVDVTLLLGEDTRYDLVMMVDFLHHIPDEDCVRLLQTAGELAGQYVLSFEPITYQPHSVGRWIVEHDRGSHVRPLDQLEALFAQASLTIVESVPLRLGPITTRAILARPAHTPPETAP